MENKIKSILYSVQDSVSSHQKYLKSLENIYQKSEFTRFVETFLKYLRQIFHKKIEIQNPYVERTLEFLAQFVSLLSKPNPDSTLTEIDEDSPSHPFLTEVISETLKFHNLIYKELRYYCCRFIALILQHIGDETHLDQYICDCIEEAMLERIMDPKTSIRLQAIRALERLQDPSNLECPVIKAYLSLLLDTNPLVRKEVLKKIAPNSLTIYKICERIRDVDCHVRAAAYLRCADLGPQLFKIVTRQHILMCGFSDDNKQVKTVFIEGLLPKWFTAYNGKFISFLAGIKLDADENDIRNTEEISKQIMNVLFSTSSIKDIIDSVPVNNDKIVDPTKLTTEVATFWNIATGFLRNSEDTEDYLDNILPELTSFCEYIQRFIDFKVSTGNKMEEWQYLEYQYILHHLFDIVEKYDFSDENGRKTLLKLVIFVLQNEKLQYKLTKKIVSIADKLILKKDLFTQEICQIISDIREPLVENTASEEEFITRKYEIGVLKVKLNILQGEIEDAVDAEEFKKAAALQIGVEEYKMKLDALEKQHETVKVKVAKDDPDTICRCLDLLSAMMELSSINVLSPSLTTFKTEFLLPLLTSNNIEINWRVLKCISLYCLLDKTIAQEYAKILCIPIITYRTVPNCNKHALMESVAAICDLMRVYSPKLFSNDEEKQVNHAISTQHNYTRRKLYTNDMADDVTGMDCNKMNVEMIIDIILDMLDDENEDIRETAVTAIAKLILNNFPVNSTLMSRIILKWFNPSEKIADKTQQKLGSLISSYAKLVKGAREVIEKSVLPIISKITNAPRTSPLADIDIDNVLKFLAAIINSNDTADTIHVHSNLAHTLFYKIASKPKDAIVPHLTKMLLYLEIPMENAATVKELISHGELLLANNEENGLDKRPRKNIAKFLEKIKTTFKNSSISEPTFHHLDNNNSDLTLNNTNQTDSQNNKIQDTSDQTVQTSTTHKDNLNRSDQNVGDKLCNLPGNARSEEGNHINDNTSKIVRNNEKDVQSSILEEQSMADEERPKRRRTQSSESSDEDHIVSKDTDNSANTSLNESDNDTRSNFKKSINSKHLMIPLVRSDIKLHSVLRSPNQNMTHLENVNVKKVKNNKQGTNETTKRRKGTDKDDYGRTESLKRTRRGRQIVKASDNLLCGKSNTKYKTNVRDKNNMTDTENDTVTTTDTEEIPGTLRKSKRIKSTHNEINKLQSNRNQNLKSDNRRFCKNKIISRNDSESNSFTSEDTLHTIDGLQTRLSKKRKSDVLNNGKKVTSLESDSSSNRSEKNNLTSSRKSVISDTSVESWDSSKRKGNTRKHKRKHRR